jgi:hypothetical protein
MAMPRQVPFWVAIVATVSAFLLTLLFGPGAFWEWRKTTVQLTAERTKASADIRDRLRVLLAQIIKLQSDPTYLQIHRAEFTALVEDYNALERGLAELEGREAVKYGFHGLQPPPPPKMMPIK